MADFKIKPAAGTGNKLILESEDGTDVLTTSDSGVAITAPTIADLSNVTGTLPVGVTGGSGLTHLASNPTVTLGSNATFPAGHIIQTVYVTNGYKSALTGDTSTHDIESSSGTTWVSSIDISSTSNHILVIPTIYITGQASNAHQDGRGHFYGWMDKAGAGYLEVLDGYYSIGSYDYGGDAIFQHQPYNHIFRVSPSFDGICNFKFTIQLNEALAVIKVNYPDQDNLSNVILMEIKG